MTTTHTPTPYRVEEDRLQPGKLFLVGPDHDGEGEPILAYSASEADGDGRQRDTFAFIAHSANYHKALRAISADLLACLKEIEEWGHHPIPHKVRATIADASRILSESATQ